MKILHLCLASSYLEGQSYQENLLSQANVDMGLEVSVISGLKSFNKNGEYTYDKNAESYTNKYGIKVEKLDYIRPLKFGRMLRKYKNTYSALEKVSPDIIFIHGVQFADVSILIKYLKKHPNISVYADNHADFSNSATNWFSKNIMHKIIWNHYAKKLEPYVIRFYGVLPARVDFLINMYGLPKNKVELLVMGADDKLAEKAYRDIDKNKIREKYGISQSDFLIVNGGKIDNAKKQTILLMDAVNQLENQNVKLIVFGSVIPELKEEIEKRCSNKVFYIGWINSEQSYDYFAAANLVCFPGRHSVFWEQVAGMGIPMLVKYWDGTTHIDMGGNVEFLHNDTVNEIKEKISEICVESKYSDMKKNAQESKDKFLYSDIAKKSIREKLSSITN